MKLLPLLLVNLATVGVGIAAYDQLRGAEAPPSVVVEGARSESAALEPRIEALEADRRPVLGGAGIDPRVLDRLDALEEKLHAQVATGGPQVPEQATDGNRPAQADPASKEGSPDEPSPDEVRRWRRVRDAVRREESLRRNRARFDKALDELSVNLTPRQRAKIYAVHAAFEPRIGEIWEEAKERAQATLAAGGQVSRAEVIAETTAIIQQEFAETLTGIVHQADAEAVASAMLVRGK